MSALTVTGDRPAVLAFVLVTAGGRVVLEILNEPGVPTVVYRAAGRTGSRRSTRRWMTAGFSPVPGSGRRGPGWSPTTSGGRLAWMSC